MEVKSLLSCNLSHIMKIKQDLHHLNNSTATKCGLFRSLKRKPDALEAVKLDPAVIEAQVTVHTKNNSKDDAEDVAQHLDNNKKVNKPTSQATTGYEDMVSQYKQALFSLTPDQMELFMKYAEMLRRQRIVTQRYLECAFCKNNGRPKFWYTSHVLKDDRGRVKCPVLRRYRCRQCGATGDHAHTIKYCPENSLLDTQSM